MSLRYLRIWLDASEKLKGEDILAEGWMTGHHAGIVAGLVEPVKEELRRVAAEAAFSNDIITLRSLVHGPKILNLVILPSSPKQGYGDGGLTVTFRTIAGDEEVVGTFLAGDTVGAVEIRLRELSMWPLWASMDFVHEDLGIVGKSCSLKDHAKLVVKGEVLDIVDVDLKALDKGGLTLAHHAAIGGSIDSLLLIMNHGGAVGCKDQQHAKKCPHANQCSQVQCPQAPACARCKAPHHDSIPGVFEMTPADHALIHGNMEVVTFLATHGFDVDPAQVVRYMFMNTFFTHGTVEHATNTLKLLVKVATIGNIPEADLRKTQQALNALATEAAKEDNVDFFSVVHEAGVGFEQYERWNENNNHVLVAARRGSVRCLQFFNGLGLNLTSRNRQAGVDTHKARRFSGEYTEAPAYVAAKAGQKAALELFRDIGADLQEAYCAAAAIRGRKTELLEWFKDIGMEFNSKTIAVAVMQGDADVLRVLKDFVNMDDPHIVKAAITSSIGMVEVAATLAEVGVNIDWVAHEKARKSILLSGSYRPGFDPISGRYTS